MYLIKMRIETKDRQGNPVVLLPGSQTAYLPKGEVERLIRLEAVEMQAGEKTDRKGEEKPVTPPSEAEENLPEAD